MNLGGSLQAFLVRFVGGYTTSLILLRQLFLAGNSGQKILACRALLANVYNKLQYPFGILLIQILINWRGRRRRDEMVVGASFQDSAVAQKL